MRPWSLFQSLGQGLESEFGVRVLGQSLGPLSGVWVRVCAPNLGQSVESEFRVKGLSSKSEFGSDFGVKVWSLGQSLRPEFGVWVRITG